MDVHKASTFSYKTDIDIRTSCTMGPAHFSMSGSAGLHQVLLSSCEERGLVAGVVAVMRVRCNSMDWWWWQSPALPGSLLVLFREALIMVERGMLCAVCCVVLCDGSVG